MLGLTSACEGEIDSARGTGGPGNVPGLAAGAGAAAGAAGGPIAGNAAMQAADQARAADEAMRAENPGLFDIALAYFPGEAILSAAPRLSRLTRTQLDLTTQAVLPQGYAGSAVDAMPGDPLQTNYEYSDNLSFNAANFTPYTAWVRSMAEGTDPASVASCAATDSACLEAAARSFVARAFRGVASETQLSRFAVFFSSSVAQVGVAEATADLIDVTLTSHAYVFRDEVLTDAAGWLLPAQRLQHLTYTLADAPPEALGLSFAEAEALVGTPEAIEATVARVLQTPEARDKLLRFFVAWLEVREPDEFTIDAGVFPEFTPEVAAAVVEETRAFLQHQLGAAAPRLTDITQSTESFVDDAMAFLYGVTAPPLGQAVQLDRSQRLGIFTQPAVIASHSGPTTTRLVKRGVFFTRKVMCLPLGVPPEDVDTTVPDIPNATERQRIEGVTTPARCQGCHAFINPFGFMQENYDAIGRWRTTDEGMPVDASIALEFLDEGPLATSSPVEAFRGLTSSMRFQQCFARQLFRFYNGRDEEPGDDPVLRQMFFQFAGDGAQDIVAMLGLLAGSPSFSQRSSTP